MEGTNAKKESQMQKEEFSRSARKRFLSYYHQKEENVEKPVSYESNFVSKQISYEQNFISKTQRNEKQIKTKSVTKGKDRIVNKIYDISVLLESPNKQNENSHSKLLKKSQSTHKNEQTKSLIYSEDRLQKQSSQQNNISVMKQSDSNSIVKDLIKLQKIRSQNAKKLLKVNNPPVYQLFQTTMQKRELPPVKLSRLKHVQVKEEKKQLNLHSPLKSMLDPKNQSFQSHHFLQPIHSINLSQCSYQQLPHQISYQQPKEFLENEDFNNLSLSMETISLDPFQTKQSHRTPSPNSIKIIDQQINLKKNTPNKLDQYYSWALNAANKSQHRQLQKNRVSQFLQNKYLDQSTINLLEGINQCERQTLSCEKLQTSKYFDGKHSLIDGDYQYNLLGGKSIRGNSTKMNQNHLILNSSLNQLDQDSTTQGRRFQKMDISKAYNSQNFLNQSLIL